MPYRHSRNVFLIVAGGNPAAERHFEDTIQHKRKLEEVRRFLPLREIENLEKIYHGSDFINPVIWAAYVIRIPITVMERAGFGASEKTQDMLIGWYARFMQFMMAIIVGLFMVREGIKFPWKEIVNWVLSR
jgi:hypothetical protein